MRPGRAFAALALVAVPFAAAPLPCTAAPAAGLDAAWRVAATGGDPFSPAVTVYFDAAGLTRAGEALAVRTLWTFAAPQPPTGHRAMRADVRVRCAALSAATVAASFHADAEAQGPALARYEPDATEWTAIAPRSIGALLVQSACAEARRRGVPSS